MDIKIADGFMDSWDRLFHWKYAPLRAWHWLLNIPREIKWFYQRGTRGYADCDTWCLNHYIASWLPEALEHLKKTKMGCPSEYFDNDAPEGKECARYDLELDKIIAGFAAYERIDDMEYITDTGIDSGKKDFMGDPTTDKVVNDTLRKEWEAEFELGMDTLKKLYFSLWD